MNWFSIRAGWTEDRVAELRRLWDKGLSASVIAFQMKCGFTRNSIIGKAHRMGLEPRKTVKRQDRRQQANGTSVKHIKLRKTGEFFVEQPVRDVIELEIPQEQRKSLLELSNAVCRYPIGEPGSGDFFFCGGPTNDKPPYCAFHTKRCFTQPTNRSTVPYRNWANK